jgi:hypothetical protein
MLCLQMEATDDATQARCLNQLCSTSIPPYCILESSSWHQLVQQLPWLLASQEASISSASRQLLMLQLAPELLTCSPAPLAQVLTALLTAATASNTPSTAQCTHAVANCSNSSDRCSDSISRCQQPQQEAVVQYPGAVVQLLVVGLHKLCRQWHFLSQEMSQQLCKAIVGVLLQSLQNFAGENLQPAAAAAAFDSDDGCRAPLVTADQPQQKQHQQNGRQQQQLDAGEQLQATTPTCLQDSLCCCLADQLVLADPRMSWLHRINANSRSGVPFRATVKDSELCLLLDKQLATAHLSQEPAAHVASNIGLEPKSATVASDIARQGCGSSMFCPNLSAGTAIQPRHCLLVHLMSVLVESPSGCKLLAGQQPPPPPLAWQGCWPGDPPLQTCRTQHNYHKSSLEHAMILYLQSWVAYWHQAGVTEAAELPDCSGCGSGASTSNQKQLGVTDLHLGALSEVIEAAASAAHVALEYNRDLSVSQMSGSTTEDAQAVCSQEAASVPVHQS